MACRVPPSFRKTAPLPDGGRLFAGSAVPPAPTFRIVMGMILRRLCAIALLSCAAAVQAATYNLPAALGTAPFGSCNPATYACSGGISIGNADTVNFTMPMTLTVNGDFSVGNNSNINGNGHAVTISVTGNIAIGNSILSSINFIAGGNISIGNAGSITGDLTAGGTLSLGTTTVNGYCSPSSSQCTNGVGGGCTSATSGYVTTVTCTDDGTFTPPSGVSVAVVEAWGGGGGGGAATGSPDKGGGGAGGQYVVKRVAIAAGSSYTIQVGPGGAGGNGSAGAAGGDSTFNGTTVVAKGGAGGGYAGTNGGDGPAGLGTTTGAIGDLAYRGGNGSAGNSSGSDCNNGGAGGGGAGTHDNGGNASGNTGGSGGTTGGGSGAAASNSSGNGASGTAPGGGGAGACAESSANRTGGSGGAGRLIITYARTLPAALADYRFDEAGWSGAANEVIDSNGGATTYPGMAASLSATEPTTANASPPIAGSPGTCRYGVFNRANKDYVALPASFPNLGTSGSFSITAWIRTTNNTQSGQRIFLDDQNNSGGYGFSLGDGGTGMVRFFSRGTPSALILDTGNVIANNAWYFVAAVADVPNKTKRIHVFDTTGALKASVRAVWTEASFGSDNGPASIGGETNASGEGSSSFGFAGNLDEVRAYQSALSTAEVAAIAIQGHACAGALDHLRIEHAGSGVTCAPTTLTLKACADAACGSYYTGGVAGTLTATGAPTVNWTGGANFNIGVGGTATKSAQVTTAGTVTWGASGVAPVPTNGTSCYIGAANSCGFTSNTAGFLFDVPHHYSDVQQAVTVSAVRQSDNSLACTPAFAGVSKTISFNCGYSDPASGTLPVAVGGTSIACGSAGGISLAFDATGVANTTVRYADVGQMSLTANYAGSGDEAGLLMTGSDTFIAAPASFTVTPAGPYVAGTPFTVTVAAKNASGVTTPNFGAESATENVALAHVLTGPAGGSDPALDGTTTLTDASFDVGNGVATASDVEWDEVGDISLTATLASASYLGSGLSATGAAATGPFKPAYFDTAVTPGTGIFTYAGQPFTVSVSAMNADGAATQNYGGTYARDVTLTDANSAANNSGSLGSFANNTIAAASFAAGVATTTAIKYDFTSKTTAPLETPGSAPLALRATDSDGVTSSGHAEGQTPVRAGRLHLINAYGSELLPPRVEYRAEYWDGNRWATNILDSATAIAAGNIATGGLTVGGIGALVNGAGFITFATAGAGSYDIAINLNASGADTSCNTTHGGTPANLPWLQGHWSGACGGTPAWQQDPSARVRLGSPKAPHIYLRERY